MRYFSSFLLRSQLMVFMGILVGHLFDQASNAYARGVLTGRAYNSGSIAPFPLFEPGPAGSGLAEVFWLCLYGLALMILAVCLERYVRPLSRTGALMTGICGYAVMAMFIS